MGSLVFFSILFSLMSFAKSSPNTDLSFDGKKIIGVELWIADSSDSALESRFGHALMRFVTETKDHFNDPVLSFEMLPDIKSTARQYNIGAVTGKFPTVIKKMSLLSALLYYSQINNRGFKRIPLRLSVREMGDLLAAIRSYFKGELKIPNYAFVGFNCSKAVLWLFQKSKIPVLASVVILPTDLEDIVRSSLLAPWNSQIVPSGSHVLSKMKYTHNDKEEIVISRQELQRLSLDDAFILSVANYLLAQQTRETLNSILSGYAKDLLDVYNLKPLPLYKYISKNECTDDLNRKMRSFSKATSDSFIINFIDPYVRLQNSSMSFDDIQNEESWSKQIEKIKNENRSKDLLMCFKKITNQ